MSLALMNVVVAALLGFGAVQELWVRGVRGGETQPFWIGLAGALVCALLALSGFALWRPLPGARTLVVLAAVSSIVFHVYAALPPHRNVGVAALIIGAGYGLLLLGITLLSGGGTREEPS